MSQTPGSSISSFFTVTPEDHQRWEAHRQMARERKGGAGNAFLTSYVQFQEQLVSAQLRSAQQMEAKRTFDEQHDKVTTRTREGDETRESTRYERKRQADTEHTERDSTGGIGYEPEM